MTLSLLASFFNVWLSELDCEGGQKSANGSQDREKDKRLVVCGRLGTPAIT